MRPAVDRICHDSKTMHRFLVFQVKSIYCKMACIVNPVCLSAFPSMGGGGKRAGGGAGVAAGVAAGEEWLSLTLIAHISMLGTSWPPWPMSISPWPIMWCA